MLVDEPQSARDIEGDPASRSVPRLAWRLLGRIAYLAAFTLTVAFLLAVLIAVALVTV